MSTVQGKAKKTVFSNPEFSNPIPLRQHLVEVAGITPTKRWQTWSKEVKIDGSRATFQITGKSTFKEEFATAGGVALNEVNFKTFESRICSNRTMGGS
ncbi:MAG: NAD(P)/FAD-dependent oxidoreductase [Saprospiraceae bacterium]